MAENFVEIKDVTKKFKENVALDHVNVSFEKGKIHGVIGRNGSGKTVLFKCICGFMELWSPIWGKYWFRGNQYVRQCRKIWELS